MADDLEDAPWAMEGGSGLPDAPWAAEKDDPYKLQARAEYDRLKARGVPIDMGYTERMIHGMTLGASDELMAAALTPFEMVKRGIWSPVEGYRHRKAFEDLLLEEARKSQGVPGHIAEIAGGVGTGMGAARAGMTLYKPAVGLLNNAARGAVEGAGYGAASGFLGEGNSLEERAKGALKAIPIGAAVGGALPLVARAVGTIAAPVISNIRARLNPEGAAASQVARAVEESGRAPAEIVADVAAAAHEGQPMFTVADAMGNAGQNKLKTAASAPGPGRTAAANFLEARQAGQGRRVQNTIAEGFDAPMTAEQAQAALTADRKAVSDVAFPAARVNAGPVDLSRAVQAIDATLQPGVTQIARPQSGLRNDTIESALEGIRSRLTDNRSVLTDYTAVERVRGDLSDQVQAAARAGQGNRARLLGGVLREMDAAMENASPGFRAANARHEQMSRNIDAVAEGRTAAQRGRSEDVVRTFGARTPENQQPYRVGYADRLIENAQGAPGVNKARFVAPEEELAALAAPGRGPVMQRRLARENTMFDTRHKVTGGSRTAENLADAEAMAVDPSILAALMHGNLASAGGRALSHASNALTGNTPAVRESLARILLDAGHGATLERTVGPQMARIARNNALVQALLRGATVGTPVGARESGLIK